MIRQTFNRIFVFAIFAYSLTALAADPSLSWKTHESEHFLIHYPQKLQHFVSKVAHLSEKSHGELSKYFNWEPKKKTHVVLLDEVDQANGFASPIPNNSMTLYMQPPTQGELLAYGDWLEMLIHHEYTHILHVDKVLDLPSMLRSIFGRFILLFPNALHPNWFQEGLATYQETDDINQVGRGQSDVFQMMMRQETLTGIKPLSRINTVAAHDWPFNSAYLYGVYFFRFIKDVYGEQAIKDLVDNYSENILPYRVNSNPRLVTGKTLEQLWPEFNDYLLGYFDPQIRRIEKQKQNSFKELNANHLAFGNLARGVAGGIWYSAIDSSQGRNLYHYKSGLEETKLKLNSLAELDVNNNEHILISQLEQCDQFSKYYDLYVFKNDELTRLTHCSRYRMAKWASNDRIVALRFDGGIARLDMLNAQGSFIKVVWQGKSGEVVSTFDVSKSGDIAASIKFGKKPWNLYLWQKNVWKAVTQDSFIQTDPSFFNGDLYFTQSQLGQVEAYKIKLKNKEKTRLSNSLSGIKQVLPHSNDQASALKYSSNGYTLVDLDLDSYSDFYEKPTLVRAEPSITELNLELDKSYSPLPSLIPSYWLPVLINDGELQEVGFFTSGNDVLGVHSYLAQLTYEKHHKRALGNLSYMYNGRWLFGLTQGLRSASSTQDISELKTQLFTGFTYPLVHVENSFYPYVAYINSQSEFISEELNLIGDLKSNDNWLAAGVIYDGLRSSLNAGGASSGWQASFSIEDADTVDNTNAEGQVLSANIRNYHTFSWSHTLAQRLFVGTGVGTQSSSDFQLGGTRSAPYVGPGIQLKLRDYALRGFNDDLTELNGENSFVYNLEYRLPFSWFDHNVMVPPVGFSGWSLRGFLDSGSAWDEGNSVGSVYTGVGAELIMDNTLFYYLNLRLRLGVAKGLGNLGSDMAYIEIGGAF